MVVRAKFPVVALGNEMWVNIFCWLGSVLVWDLKSKVVSLRI